MKEYQIPFQSNKKSHELLKELNTLKQKLNEYKKKLEETQLELSENNSALNALARNIDKIKLETNMKILKKLYSQILPI